MSSLEGPGERYSSDDDRVVDFNDGDDLDIRHDTDSGEKPLSAYLDDRPPHWD